jgi:hypothetical protein
MCKFSLYVKIFVSYVEQLSDQGQLMLQPEGS